MIHSSAAWARSTRDRIRHVAHEQSPLLASTSESELAGRATEARCPPRPKAYRAYAGACRSHGEDLDHLAGHRALAAHAHLGIVVRVAGVEGHDPGDRAAEERVQRWIDVRSISSAVTTVTGFGLSRRWVSTTLPASTSSSSGRAEISSARSAVVSSPSVAVTDCPASA